MERDVFGAALFSYNGLVGGRRNTDILLVFPPTIDNLIEKREPCSIARQMRTTA